MNRGRMIGWLNMQLGTGITCLLYRSGVCKIRLVCRLFDFFAHMNRTDTLECILVPLSNFMLPHNMQTAAT